MRLKSASEQLNFVMAKLYQKVIHYIVAANARACPRIVTHSNTASFSIKITFFVKLTKQYRFQ